MADRTLLRVLILAIWFFSGCGESSVPSSGDAPPVGPHGGPIVALPADAYAEVVFESGPVSAKTKPPTFQVAVYFYRGPELTTPLLPAPTDVRFELELPDREPVSLELKDESSNGQATGTRFVSEDRHESLDTIVGTIYATIGGESVTKPVITPR